MIGIQLPAGFLLILAPDPYLDAVHRPAVRSPDSSENQAIGFLALSVGSSDGTATLAHQQEQECSASGKQKDGGTTGGNARADLRKSHRLQLPLLLRRPRI